MSQSIIEITNLSFIVNKQTILKNISFDVNSGDLITISGPSGSGKSTLLKLIGNMLPKSEGEILFKQKRLEDYETTDYRKDVSYFFQNPVLFGKTVKDNLVFPYYIRSLPFDTKRAISLLKQVKLTADYLEKPIDSLSGGEKQRIAFVRNLLFQPKVLLLDEVTSALDPENSRIIHDIIQNLNKNENVTILWITHNQDEFLASSKRLIVNEGNVTIKENNHE